MKQNNNIYNMDENEFEKMISDPAVVEFMNHLEYVAFVVTILKREFIIVMN